MKHFSVCLILSYEDYICVDKCRPRDLHIGILGIIDSLGKSNRISMVTIGVVKPSNNIPNKDQRGKISSTHLLP